MNETAINCKDKEMVKIISKIQKDKNLTKEQAIGHLACKGVNANENDEWY